MSERRARRLFNANTNFNNERKKGLIRELLFEKKKQTNKKRKHGIRVQKVCLYFFLFFFFYIEHHRRKREGKIKSVQIY